VKFCHRQKQTQKKFCEILSSTEANAEKILSF
jgi:hypothetical protein